MKRYLDALKKFMDYQASGGILLLVTTILAIIFANSTYSTIYHHFLEFPLGIQIGNLIGKHSLEHFVNDGLMAIFFLLVSLEVKREVIEGQLSTRDQQILPVLAAVGGVVIPALIYVFINSGNIVNGVSTVHGWAIPSATDIAFALGIISLFGKRVPISLKVFLTALAIIDDLGAILIIAIFYNNDLQVTNLLWALLTTLVLFYMNANKVTNKAPYLLFGFLLWVFILNSGIHATIAGVLLGLSIPMQGPRKTSPLKSLEHKLEPWCAFFILPLFAFCNAGINLEGVSIMQIFSNPLSLGITAGLFLGKQLGVFFTIFFLVKLGVAKMPENSCWRQVYGMSLLTGIGFTMSIFIGNLAFDPALGLQNDVRVGILMGSLLSAVFGFLVLHLCCPKKKAQ
jgi:NhaA family Na+:H+ antiporter